MWTTTPPAQEGHWWYRKTLTGQKSIAELVRGSYGTMYAILLGECATNVDSMRGTEWWPIPIKGPEESQ